MVGELEATFEIPRGRSTAISTSTAIGVEKLSFWLRLPLARQFLSLGDLRRVMRSAMLSLYFIAKLLPRAADKLSHLCART